MTVTLLQNAQFLMGMPPLRHFILLAYVTRVHVYMRSVIRSLSSFLIIHVECHHTSKVRCFASDLRDGFMLRPRRHLK